MDLSSLVVLGLDSQPATIICRFVVVKMVKSVACGNKLHLNEQLSSLEKQMDEAINQMKGLKGLMERVKELMVFTKAKENP